MGKTNLNDFKKNERTNVFKEPATEQETKTEPEIKICRQAAVYFSLEEGEKITRKKDAKEREIGVPISMCAFIKLYLRKTDCI